jgi:hypothetical protein
MRRIFYALPIAALAGLALSAQGATAATRPAAMHVSPAGLGSTRAVTHVHSNGTVNGSGSVAGPLWVSSTAPIAGDKSCTKPGFNTISAALAVADSGATIYVCGGTYAEQLAITQGVKLIARGPVTVVGPLSPSTSATATSCDADGGSQPNQDVVDICTTGATSSNVSITGFTIEGNWPADVCNDSLYGVAVLGGAALTMSNSTVEGAGGDPQTDGCQGGVGIQVGEATSGTTADTGSATLTNDIVNTYQKNGITIDGTGSSAVLKTDTVTGTGETPAIGQNGIQVSDGANATISGTLVTGNECDNAACGSGPFDTQATGILLFDAGTTKVMNSTVNGNDDGIYNVEDYAWSYYTPASPFVPINETFSKLSMNNRYENASFDAGKSTLTGSTLTGGEAGLQVLQYNGQAASAMATANTDTITGASVAAVQVASDGTAGDMPITLSVTTSDFDTSNAAGVQNQSTSIVTATKDWWGDASGPSVWSFGAGSSVTSDVNFFPWSTNSGNTSFETCTTGNNHTATGNNVVLCAANGTAPAYLANGGTGNVLLIGNKGNDQLVGSASGETWIIGAAGNGSNVINGNGGSGYIQERGDSNDTLIGTSGYTVAAN